MTLMASNLPPVPPGKAYELWVIPPQGAPVNAGVFKPDEHGNAMMLDHALPDRCPAEDLRADRGRRSRLRQADLAHRDCGNHGRGAVGALDGYLSCLLRAAPSAKWADGHQDRAMATKIALFLPNFASRGGLQADEGSAFHFFNALLNSCPKRAPNTAP